jgi:hypothetical protein
LVDAIRNHVDIMNKSRLYSISNNSLQHELINSHMSPDESLGKIFSTRLSGDDRVKELMRMLEW